jgi:hypothetical protein
MECEAWRKKERAYELLYYSSIREYSHIISNPKLGHLGFYDKDLLNINDLPGYYSTTECYDAPFLSVWFAQLLPRISRILLASESKGVPYWLNSRYETLNRAAEECRLGYLPHDPHPRDFVGSLGVELMVNEVMRDLWSFKKTYIIRDLYGTLSEKDGDTLNGKGVDWEAVKAWYASASARSKKIDRSSQSSCGQVEQ